MAAGGILDASGEQTTVLVLLYFGALVCQDWTIEALWVHHPDLQADVGTLGIIFAQFVACFVLPLVCGRDQHRRFIPSGGLKGWGTYVALTCLVFLSTGLANVSVAWVQYPVKVVFKSSKLLPTMAVALFMGNHEPFTVTEMAAAVFTVVGTCGFSWDAGRHDTGQGAGMLATIGILCLFGSVAADAFTTNLQQRLLRHPSAPDDPMVLMFRTNLLGALAVGTAIVLSPSRLHMASAVGASPWIPGYFAVIGVCLAAGVWALTTLIGAKGAVLAIHVATLRKVVTVMLSYITFPKPFSWLHGCSAALVLVGLVLGDAAQRRRKQGNCEKASTSQRAGPAIGMPTEDADETGEEVELVGSPDAVGSEADKRV
mmetsp:Transcript_42089/g.116283  ORF Transcript_42089/g.116283 Transcript_42089/m.116283 type:complete len:371 (-) Transcript_42089:38-1150(-)